MNAHCDLCNGLYGMRHPTQWFCGNKCRKKSQRIQADRRDERAAAQRMTNRLLTPRRERYSEVCVMCSRTAVDHCMSDQEARGYVVRGLRRCPRAFCGGVLQLVALDGVR